MKLGGMGRNVLKVVKNRLGQAGARLQFTIVDGDDRLHLLFERLGEQALPKPRRLVDAAFDEMMRILMTQDERKFDRAGLIKLLQDRLSLPSTRSLREAFVVLGKDKRVRVERDEAAKMLLLGSARHRRAGEQGLRLAAGDGHRYRQLLSALQSPHEPGGARDGKDERQSQLSGIVGATGWFAGKG